MSGDGLLRPRCVAAFSQHEGLYVPTHVALNFTDWARRTLAPLEKQATQASSVMDRLRRSAGFGGQGIEELYLQSFILTRMPGSFWENGICILRSAKICIAGEYAASRAGRVAFH